MNEVLDFKYENEIVEHKIKNIKLYKKMFHTIDTEHLNNFVIYANDYNMSGVKLSIFYKIGKENLLFIESFFLDCNYPLKFLLNWQNYEHKNFNNFNNLTDLDFKLCYKMILNENGILNLELFKGNIIELNQEVIDKTKRHTDGYHINNNDFNFQIILWEILQKDYTNLSINKIRTKSFKNITCDTNHTFYKNLYDESIYLRYMIQKQSIFCDKCKKEIHSFKEKKGVTKHWDYKGLVHLCDRCYVKKLDKENYRKKYIKRLILLQGKRKVFQKRLQEVKKIKYNFNEIKDIKFYKNMIKGLVLDISKDNDKKICTICYDHFLDKKLAAGRCGHVFHLSCIKSLTSCPICREPNPEFTELFF